MSYVLERETKTLQRVENTITRLHDTGNYHCYHTRSSYSKPLHSVTASMNDNETFRRIIINFFLPQILLSLISRELFKFFEQM